MASLSISVVGMISGWGLWWLGVVLLGLDRCIVSKVLVCGMSVNVLVMIWSSLNSSSSQLNVNSNEE